MTNHGVLVRFIQVRNFCICAVQLIAPTPRYPGGRGEKGVQVLGLAQNASPKLGGCSFTLLAWLVFSATVTIPTREQPQKSV